MSGVVAAKYFDGRSSATRDVLLHFEADRTLRLVFVDALGRATPETSTLRFSQRDVTVESRLGNAPRFVRLTDDQRCEVADNDGLDEAASVWGRSTAAAWLHRVEQSWRWAIAALVVCGVIAWVTIWFGLPWGAQRVAAMLPADITQRMSDDSLVLLDRTVFQPSALTAERQTVLRDDFAKLLTAGGDTTVYRVEFRGGGRMGANDFALPSGVIVMTDELVALAEDDLEILGVLAHEAGHVQHRHILRNVLQSSAVAVMITLITGDPSSAAAIGAALPTYLLQSKFSREFEAEADAYAVALLRRAGRSPEALATMLERLEKAHRLVAESKEERGAAEKALDYFSTHPPTPERVKTIRGER